MLVMIKLNKIVKVSIPKEWIKTFLVSVIGLLVMIISVSVGTAIIIGSVWYNNSL